MSALGGKRTLADTTLLSTALAAFTAFYSSQSSRRLSGSGRSLISIGISGQANRSQQLLWRERFRKKPATRNAMRRYRARINLPAYVDDIHIRLEGSGTPSHIIAGCSVPKVDVDEDWIERPAVDEGPVGRRVSTHAGKLYLSWGEHPQHIADHVTEADLVIDQQDAPATVILKHQSTTFPTGRRSRNADVEVRFPT